MRYMRLDMRYEMVFKVHDDSLWILCTAVKLPLRTHRTSGEHSPMLATQECTRPH